MGIVTVRDGVAWGAVPMAAAAKAELPARVRVAVVGGGYTGLAAARAIAMAGGEVVVLEQHGVGHGASGRNAGFVLPGFQASAEALRRLVGPELARALFRDSLAAVAFVERLVSEEQIACHWARVGYLHLAAKPSHVARLGREQALLADEFGYRTQLLDRGALRAELDSNHYHGALLEPDAGCLDPRAYLDGLAAAARRAGVRVCEGTAVQLVRGAGKSFRVETDRGAVHADEVIIATNGYTGSLHPWLARRFVSLGSFIVTTGPLDPALRARLIPHGRVMADSRHLLRYFRFTPDGRLLFGGRAAFVPGAVERSIALLARELRAVFPALAEVPVEYGWGGRVAVPRHGLPHIGRTPDGVHYALGYAGHGIANATWLGDRLGRVILGRAEWPGLARIPFPVIPFHRGTRWLLPLAGAYYRVRDWLS